MNHTTTDAERSQEATEASIPVTRPSWLPNGCPSWCEWPDDHPESAQYDDRVHTARPIPLIVMTATTLRESERESDHPDTVAANLMQHYREVTPRIQIERNDGVTGIELTPDEAEALGDMLLKLAAIARAK